jgi:hypothetical protein
VELVEPVEQSVPEALEASGPVPLAAAAEDEVGTCDSLCICNARLIF